MTNLILTMIINSNYFPGIVHERSWWCLRVESCALREKGLARGSWANRVSHLRSYIDFTVYFGVQDFPVLLGVLLRFIAILGRGPYTFESASNIISSVKYFSSVLDPPSKVFEAVLVADALKGLKVQLSRPVHQKLPILVEHLVRFHGALDLASPKLLAAWCAMLLAFFGCLRVSNIVPAAQSSFDPLKHLKRDDIKFVDGIMLVFFKWSKTNQSARKASWIPVASVSDPRFNISENFKKLLSSVKGPGSAPLFTFEGASFHTKNSLTTVLNMCVAEAGLPLADYSWHSFRRGAAVFAYELGLDDSAVQLLGDWASSAFKTYLEFSFLKKVSVAEAIANSFEFCLKKC